ncbi:RDD family protein [Thalassotalea sp. 1_MG-2023]|uniref:RDD family protein n=1 Tax=Thalassotalea sp. 1_MG-2023 TaxID=3062680 RepID=UPI0026E2C290|nr:RDD family protein [Thalassotalea sp. 1_MG-2023]MDO6428688.1 RDD family protein [Thalassotalea sp. 1_MG-2023]
MMSSVDFTVFPRAGFMRRFGAWVYDALLAIAVYMVAGAIGFGLFKIAATLGLVNMNGHQHLIDVQQSSYLYSALIYGWNFSWVIYFFLFFWARSGQTLGMKAWRLRLQHLDGQLINKKLGLIRIIYSIFGLGNIWLFIEWKHKLSLQDKLTNTEIVVLSLAANKAKI